MDFGDYPFTSDQAHTMSIAPSLSRHMTLRNACSDYADAGGIAWDNAVAPETSCATSAGQVTCMNKIDPVVGIPMEGSAILFDVAELDTCIDVLDFVSDLLRESVDSGVLWCIRRTRRYSRQNGRWKSENVTLNKDASDILNTVENCGFVPVTVSTVHAAVEASKYSSSAMFDKLYLYPHNSTCSNGIIGTLADNEALDMVPDEDSNSPNTTAREWKPEYGGFICAGKTSHSTEAGRMRAVAVDTYVRILSATTLASLDSLRSSLRAENHHDRGARTWTVFVMGKYCKASLSEIIVIVQNNAMQSNTDLCMYSVYVNSHLKVAVLNCAPGTLIKRCAGNVSGDSCELYKSHRLPGYKDIRASDGNDNSSKFYHSAFFSLFTYLESDRPPRTLIASVQVPQAQCLPWFPGTAAVSPCYTFNPITTSPLYKAVMKDQAVNNANIATYLPGENVGVLFLNLDENYEDAILVSQRYIDHGGFSSISIAPYLLSQSEYVPPVGSQLCSVLCPWWKSPCQPHCSHTEESLLKRRVYNTSFNKPTGTVFSVDRTPQGEWSVKVKSFQCLQQGDKLSTCHGQKGITVRNILTPENLPIIVSDSDVEIVPDVVVAMSSIVTRQTNGQLYEAAKSLDLLSSNIALPYVPEVGEVADVSRDFNVIDARTGRSFTTHFRNDDGSVSIRPTRASFGYVRMFAQTQMSRERHQVTHVSPSKHTLRTTTGRSRGGGVAWSEMDVQASVAAGLLACNAEISARGSIITFPICTWCKRLAPSCKRTDGCIHVQTAIPYDQVVCSIVTKIVYGYDILYDVEVVD